MEWIEEIYALIDSAKSEMSPNIDAAVDILFGKVDCLLQAGNFAEVNEIIQVINLDRLNPTLLVGLLCASLWARDRLPYRPTLVERVEAMFNDLCPEETEGLMRGLK